ncbi:hypothetical protein NQ314_003458 [Rhamnusium bicolor]|uniref:Uncharacterized protein n=1 Tax=Rhamnusium bicolor TaxID=1586634 RepID=A0AAV8ZNQ6_9CUCU|nr:hypothetical protein NQ314_003458 [Rhamnusium bicolor]
MLKKKEKSSPRIEKKSKNKKSKSSSKLYDLKKDENNDSLSSENATPEKQEGAGKEIVNSTAKTAKIENKYFIKCLEEYKKFFVCFIKTKILPETDTTTFFKALICNKNERMNQLLKLLDDRLQDNLTCEFSPADIINNLNKNEILSVSNVASERATCEYEKSMSVASNILLEFSAFPNLLGSTAEKNVPAWIEALVVAACCKESSREIQITAMNALLEIFSLANNQTLTKKDDCNTNIVITGILELIHVKYIEENTVVIEEMSQILWKLLGILNNQNQLMLCITLLYQIHNTFDSKLFVEQVIGNFLTQENITVNYIKQFFLLWHLGRDLNIKLPPNKSHITNFDRSLLKVLDNLQNKDRPNLQLLAEMFLTHSLLHNDISRIINPILLKLLASNTARVSIRHVNIHDSDTQSDITSQDSNKMEDSQAKKIYAVSSINGNIMYHLTNGPSPKPPKKKWFTFSKTGKKYSSSVINMTTSITEDSSIVTKKNKDFKGFNVSPKLDKGSKGNVKLIINPLSSKEVYPTGLDGSYSKLDSHSSLESLSSSNEYTHTSNDDSLIRNFQQEVYGGDRDSGFDSLKNKSQSELLNMINNGKEFTTKALLESMEPISDGIKAQAINGNVGLGKIPKSHSFDEKINNIKTTDIESSLVQSWSYCISDSANLHCELELSKSAEDFFKGKSEEHAIVTNILNNIIDKVCSEVDDDVDYAPQRPTDLDLRPKMNSHVSKNFVLYPIHSHVCLYYEIFDSNQVLYALQILKNCILSNPQLFIKCLATSGIKNLRNNEILYLLARHRKSLLGCGFYGELSNDSSLMSEELHNNLKIQLESLEILDVIVKNLVTMAGENSKGFSSYIADLLVKCKLQKILLNCLLTSVRNFDEDMTFAEEILGFNNFQLSGSNNKLGEHVEAFQIQILRLIHSLIILEHAVFPPKPQTGEAGSSTNGEHLNTPVVLIPQQAIFLSAIMSALRHDNMKHIHEKWLNMVTSCLPYFGDSLKQISISVIHQICNNIEDIAINYKKFEVGDELCSDYAVTQLESLTILCHYCLLDSSQTVNQNVPVNPSTPVSNPGEIINNLFNAFFSPLSSDINFSAKQNSDNYQNARKTILSHMPRIISSVAKLWQTIVNLENDYNGVLPEPNAGQNNLVYLILAIRVIPLDNLVQTVTAVIKNPPPTEGLSADICLDVSVLELFYCYMRNASATQLSEAWGSLLALIREGCSLSPPAQFLLAALLHELMIKCCPLEERKDQKDLQDVTAKLIDCVSQVCGSCLEQTTWLRRNFAVREQEEDTTPDSSIISGSTSDIFVNSSHSVQAQLVLSGNSGSYSRYLLWILGKGQKQLTSSLRLSMPGVQAQVFLCFRVILIRMSPLHVTSLWPIIISEMLQVFLQIEQELSTDTEEFSSHIKLMSSLDASWATNSSNGLHALGHPHWLRLQLSTAKLLDLALLLPATTLPQFQMYRWAFVGDDLIRKDDPFHQVSFMPHVVRIADLMDKKFPDTQIDILPMKRNELLLTMNNITQLKDLHSFFKTLSSCSNRHRTECGRSITSDYTFSDRQTDKKLDMILEKIDKVIEMDFLDRIPR